ncbi:MAG: NUDIX domain-containing protein [Candidatus Nanohaloarchaea archaeon]
MKEPEVVEVATAVTYNPEREEFLLLKRADTHEPFSEKWEFPAGMIEGEDPKHAALRELEEETGLKGEFLREGKRFNVDTGGDTYRVHPVLVAVNSEEVELSREHVDYRWVSRDEALEMDTVKGFRKDLENVGVIDG